MVVNKYFEHKQEFNEKWRRMLQKAAEIELEITKRKDFDTKLHKFLRDEAADYGLTQAHFINELNGYLRKGKEYIEAQKGDLKTLKSRGDTKGKVQRILAGIPASPEIGIWPDKESTKTDTKHNQQDYHDAMVQISKLANTNKSLTTDNDKLLKDQETTKKENDDLKQRIADLEAQLAAGTTPLNKPEASETIEVPKKLIFQQLKYGKIVQYKDGPIIPLIEHHATGTSKGFPYKQTICTGFHPDSPYSHKDKSPWKEEGGEIVTREVEIDGITYVICGKHEYRSEDGKKKAGRLYHEQHFIAIPKEEWSIAVLPKLTELLNTEPVVKDEKNKELNPIEVELPSPDSKLPEGWFDEYVQDLISNIVSGQQIRIQDWDISEKEFLQKLYYALLCIPLPIANKISFGTGLLAPGSKYNINVAHCFDAGNGRRKIGGEWHDSTEKDEKFGEKYIKHLKKANINKAKQLKEVLQATPTLQVKKSVYKHFGMNLDTSYEEELVKKWLAIKSTNTATPGDTDTGPSTGPVTPTPPEDTDAGPSQQDLDDANDKITNLEAEKDALNGAKKFTESQNTDLTQQVTKLEAEKDLLKGATESADKEIRESQQKITKLEEKIAAGTDTGASQEELEAANQEIAELKDQIEKFTDLEQEVKRLEARREAQATRITELKEEVRILENKDSRSIGEVSEIRHQLQDAITKLEESKKELEQTRTTLEEYKDQQAETEQQVTSIQAELDAANELNEQNTTTITEISEKLTEKTNQLETLRGRYRTLKETSDRDIREKEVQIADLQSKLEELERELIEAKEKQAEGSQEQADKITALEFELTETKRLKEDAEKTIGSLNEAIKSWESKLEEIYEGIEKQKIKTATKIQELKDELQNANNQNDQLQAKVDQLEEESDTKEKRIKELDLNLSENNAERMRLTSQVLNLEQQLKDAKSKLEEGNEEQAKKITALEEELTTIKELKTRADRRIEKLTKDLETIRSSLKMIEEELNKKLAASEAEIKKIGTQLKQSEKELEESDLLLQAEREDHTGTKKELERFGEEVETLSDQRDEYKFHYEDEKQRAAKFSEELESTKQGLEAAIAEKDITQRELDATRAEMTRLSKEVKDLETQIDEALKKVEDIKDENKEINEMNDKLLINKDQLERELQGIKKQNVSLLSSNKRLEAKNKRIQESLKVVNSELNDLVRQKSDLEDKLEKAESLVNRKDEELLEMKGQISVVEVERDDMRKSLKAAADEIIAQKRTIDELSEEATTLSNSLATAETTILQQESTIEQLRSNLEAANEAIEDEIRRRRLAEKETSEVTKERNHYRTQLTEAERDISTLSGQVEQLRTEREKAIGALKKKTEDFAKVSAFLDTYKEENKNLKTENNRINKEISELESDLSDAIEAVRATDRTRNISEKEKLALAKRVKTLEKQLEDFRGVKKELEKQTKLVKELDRLSKKDVIEIGRLKEQIKDLEWKKESTKKENKRLHEAFEANKQSTSRIPVAGASQINKIKAHRNRRLGTTGSHKRKKPNNRKDTEITDDNLE